ncbi:hypothetical protein HMPREF3185_00983 [Porphyromonas somerae]|uniref:Uncharacterized protein n=1 Tax=Porphyromonas somerae TaxID=322095 RepID=A0A134B8T9_9PORP|nr:hypothetical protein HMPREF3184_00983 [Porphyromonadaceae bacterium KA00676]KXB76354.1 hypothetical protein HMPREF3185_00983 [Porphyromonas somerae]
MVAPPLQGGDMNLYWSAGEAILVARRTYIGQPANLYRSTH